MVLNQSTVSFNYNNFWTSIIKIFLFVLSFIDSLKNTKLQFLIPTENLNIYGEWL